MNEFDRPDFFGLQDGGNLGNLTPTSVGSLNGSPGFSSVAAREDHQHQIQKTPYCWLQDGTVVNVPNATYTMMPWTSVVYDTDNFYTAGSNRIVIPYTGLYDFGFIRQAFTTVALMYLEMFIAVNGNIGVPTYSDRWISNGQHNANEGWMNSASGSRPFNKGDYLEVWCWQNSGAAKNIGTIFTTDNKFWIKLVGIL